MEGTLKKCLDASGDPRVFSSALEDLQRLRSCRSYAFDGVNFDTFLNDDNGILSRLSSSCLEECTSIVKLCVALFSLGAPFSEDQLSRLAANIFSCMCRHIDSDFWKLCLNDFLCKIATRLLSNPSATVRAFARLHLHGITTKRFLKDIPTGTGFSKFTLMVLEASTKQDAALGLCDYKDLFRFVKDVLPLIRHGYGDFVQTLANLLSLILHNHSNAPCVFNELYEESREVVFFVLKFFKCNSAAALDVLRDIIHLCPKVFLSKGSYGPFVDFLLCLLRVSPSNTGAELCGTWGPSDALSLFSDLLRQIEISEDLKSIMAFQAYMKFFDVLRAFPIGSGHSTSRLLAWWRFLCLLPEKMLSDGFRRFVSPFLANLLGRYISITACLGDPNFHRYQLSSTSVYNGDATAQDLAAHVFSCIFDYPEMEPELFLSKEKLPKLVVSSSFLSEHNYQLLVAVFHWLRYLSGSGKSVGDRKVGDIWIKCLKCIRKAISEYKSDDEMFRKAFVQRSLDISLRLVSPQTPCDDSPPGSLIEPSDIDISQNPSPGDCLTILHEMAASLDFEKASWELKSALNYDICASCLNLISAWHRDCCSSGLVVDLSQDDIMKDLGLLAVESVEKDTRLAVTASVVATTDDDYLKLLRALLATLVPECTNFVDRHLKLLDTLYCIPSSNVIVTLNTARVNEAGLQVWVSLTDRLTQLTAVHKRVTDLPKNSAKDEAHDLGSDLSTMFAFCLAPVFLAGNSTNSPPPELEQKVLSTLLGLFRVLHAEACLLTSLPINSWIDKLSDLIIALIQNEASEFGKKINLRIISNFLFFMVNSAEGIEENFKDPFSPSKWRVRKDRPLGQMTGPVNAISCCLGVMPLEQSEMSVCNSMFVSPTRRQSCRSRNILALHTVTSGPQSPTKLYEIVFLENERQQSSQTAQSVTRNLLHSLFLILQRHIRSVETLLLLIELSSTGLLALAKRLNSTSTLFRDDEAPAIIVTAFEAFVTLAWNRLQKCFCKPGVVESPRQQKEQELKPLELPRHAVRQLLVFFEAAVSLASSPFSDLEYRFAAAAKDAGASPLSSGHSKLINYKAIISRRRKVFIMCIVSLWDTLVVSAPADATDLRDRVRDLTGQFSRCLVGVVSPQVSLHRRVTFPDWISPTLLLGREADQSETENDPPHSPSKRSSAQSNRKVSRRLCRGVNNKELEEAKPVKSHKEGRQEDCLKSAHEPTPGHFDTTEISHLSSSQTPPGQSLCSPFLASRRLGTATDPRYSLPPRQASIIARRRLALAAPRAASQLPPVPQLQRRLFSEDGNNDAIGVTTSSTSTESKVLPSSRSRKRLNPSNSDRRPPPNLADFEDSTQFVFIPPSNCASKRMRLTEHQKERRREQRRAYLPAMYNNLDASHVSASSNAFSPISSSSSQSLRHPPRVQATTPLAGLPESLIVADSQPSPFSPKTTNVTTGTSFGGTTSAFETTRGSRKESSVQATDVSNVPPQGSKTVDGSLPEPAFEEEVPMRPEPGESEGISEDVEEGEADADVSMVVGTEPSQHRVTSTEDALAASQGQTTLTSPLLSPMLSASPVVSRAGSAMLRSPLIGSPAGLRAQRILEMGLAKAAKRGKQRMFLPGSGADSQFSSPVTSGAKPSDSPGSRPGILRDITTPRPKTRVSFVEQPTVFILNSSESSPNALWLREVDSSTFKTFSVVPSSPPTSVTPEMIVVADPQNPQQKEICYPPADTSSLLKGVEVRQAESYSPPSLSSPVGNRRRKSTPPRRCTPIDRTSREALRSSLSCFEGAGARLHLPTRRRLFTESEDSWSSSRVVSTPATVEGTEVDLDAITSVHSSPLRVIVSKNSQKSSLVVKMMTTTQDKELTEAEVHGEGGLVSATKSNIQVVSSGKLIEESNEKGVNNEDVVKGSLELDDAEVIIVSDTEAEQLGEQSERNKGGKEVQHESMDTTLVDATIGNVAQGDAIEQTRRTIGSLRDQLLLISSEQQKELLLEVLALFKNIIP